MKHYPYRTEETYIQWIKRYTLCVFRNTRHLEEMGDNEIRAFVIYARVLQRGGRAVRSSLDVDK